MRSRSHELKYTVIGGAGAMGRIVVRDLFKTAGPHCTILIADYDRNAAAALASSYRSSRVKSCKIDVRNLRQAARLLKSTAVIINCVHYHLNLQVMKIALAAGAHYVDLGGLFHVTRKQRSLDGQFRRAGLTAVIGMGAAPGIANLLAQRAVEQLDVVREIHIRIGSIDKTQYRFLPALPTSYSIKTILEEFSLKPALFCKGKFKFVEPLSGQAAHKFPAPVGIQTPMYTLHSEVATLPLSFAKKGVREVSFKIGFDPEFIARVRFLRDTGLASAKEIDIKGSKVAPLDLVDRVIMSQPKPVPHGRLRQYEVVRAIVKGNSNAKKVTNVIDCHTSGMPAWGIGLDINTGSPPSVVAQMLAANVILQRGVLAPETAVPQAKFFQELQRRGMHVKQKKLRGWGFRV